MADEVVVPVVPEKLWWQSKTAWVNLLAGGVALLFPDMLGSFLTESNLVMLISVVNILLRAVTKTGIAREIL